MQKVKCPQCKSLTYPAAACNVCGAKMEFGEDALTHQLNSINQQAELEVKQYDFHSKYREMQTGLGLQGIQIARSSFYNKLAGTLSWGIRRLNVPKGWKALVYSDHGTLELSLDAGSYPVSKQHMGGNPFVGFLDSFQHSQLGVFMVPTGAVQLTFMVPEGGDKAPFAQLSVCNIRSAEGLSGGVAVTMLLEVVDPVRLFYLFCSGIQQPEGKEESQGLWKRLFGGKEAAETVTEAIDASCLWRSVRVEFVQCVRAAVLNHSADEMRDSPSVRESVQQSIGQSMSATFGRCGIRLVQVTGFTFMSPEHDQILAQRAQIAADRENLEIESERSKIRKSMRDVNRQDAVDALHSEGVVDQAEAERDAALAKKRLEEQGGVDRVSDALKAEEQVRDHALDAVDQDHRRLQDGQNRSHARTQHEADERLKIDLTTEKIRRAIELKNLAEEGALQRRLKMIKAIAESGLDTQSVLALQLGEHPELAPAYIEATRAMGHEQVIRMQKEFEQKISLLAVQDKAHVNALLQEGIKQIGSVMTASQMKQQPRLIATPGGTVGWQADEAAPKAHSDDVPAENRGNSKVGQ